LITPIQGIEEALGFWGLLLPLGLKGGALAHIKSSDGGDVNMEPEEGWKPEYTDWWFEFLTEKKIKGISKDTWLMVCIKLFFLLICA
jgi:DCN1-like protein 1/2